MDFLAGHSLIERHLVLIAALFFSALLFQPLRRLLCIDKCAAIPAAFIFWCERKLNRGKRSSGTLVYRGIIMPMCLLLIAFALGVGLQQLFSLHSYLVLIEMLMLATMLQFRHVFDQSHRAAKHLRKNALNDAAQAAAMLGRRDLKNLDSHAVCRLCIEHLAENFSDKVVATALAYLLLGLPGACLLRIIHLADALVGYRSMRYVAFGWAAAKMDDTVQFIPARLTAFLLFLAAFFIPRCRPMAALRTLFKEAGNTSSLNNGWPIAAMAGALHVSLAGPRTRGEGVIDDAWIGKGTARATQRDVKRAEWIYFTSGLIFILGLVGGLFVLKLNQ